MENEKLIYHLVAAMHSGNNMRNVNELRYDHVCPGAAPCPYIHMRAVYDNNPEYWNIRGD